jgi:hypothetical protein
MTSVSRLRRSPSLETELVNATDTEGWLRSRPWRSQQATPELANLMEAGRAYRRIAREVIASALVMRGEEKDGGPPARTRDR